MHIVGLSTLLITGLALLGQNIARPRAPSLERMTFCASIAAGGIALPVWMLTDDPANAEILLLTGSLLTAPRLLALFTRKPDGVSWKGPLRWPRVQAGLSLLMAMITAAVWGLLVDLDAGVATGAAALVLSWPHFPDLLDQAVVRRAFKTAREFGAEFNGPAALTALSRTQSVAFDKASLLQSSVPVVTDIQSFDNKPEPLLSVAASAEYFARHTIGAAIRAIADDWGLAQAAPDEWEEVPGLGCVAMIGGKSVAVGNGKLMSELGIDCFTANAMCKPFQSDGKTCIFVAVGTRLVGLIALQSALDPDTPPVLANLKQRKIRTLIVTGTDQRAAEGFARNLTEANILTDIRQADRLSAAEKALGDAEAVFMSVADSGRRGLFSLSPAAAMSERLMVSIETGRLGTFPALLDLAAETVERLRLLRLVACVIGLLIGLSGSLGLVSIQIAAFVLLLVAGTVLALTRRVDP
ncbi:HAD family hydrolase [Roseibium sp.]|uniref:HAD family hydrolase n=1 Tax=Roseibium sp. TaxID=1936156 RepID=UPI003A97C496